MIVAMTITLGAVAVTIINIRSNTSYTNGEIALQNAQSGVENAMIRLERDPNYTGESMPTSSGSATITISGTSTKTIVSVGSIGNFKRTITATVTNTSSVYTLTSWIETP